LGGRGEGDIGKREGINGGGGEDGDRGENGNAWANPTSSNLLFENVILSCFYVRKKV
jgi:hypothetical protein